MPYKTNLFIGQDIAKKKIKKLIFLKRNDFGGFQLLEMTGKTSKNHQISICGFECIAKI
jgi:hypothetical protein